MIVDILAFCIYSIRNQAAQVERFWLSSLAASGKTNTSGGLSDARRGYQRGAIVSPFINRIVR